MVIVVAEMRPSERTQSRHYKGRKPGGRGQGSPGKTQHKILEYSPGGVTHYGLNSMRKEV